MIVFLSTSYKNHSIKKNNMKNIKEDPSLNSLSQIYVYDFTSKEITEGREWHTEIRMYGLNKYGESTCIRIDQTNIKIYLDFVDREYVYSHKDKIIEELKNLVYDRQVKKSIKIVEKERLYWCNYDFENMKKNTFPFIQVEFKCKISMLSFRKKLYGIKKNFKYEPKIQHDKVSPELQFMVDHDIDPCGWVKVKKFTMLSENDPDRVTDCDREFIVESSDIKKSDIQRPVDINVMAWDIEANCEKIAQCPGESENDCVFQISCVFHKLISREKKKVLLTLGKCARFDDETEIIVFSSERDIIIGFSDLIKRERPNILTGWNIFNFDTKFLLARAERNLCKAELLSYGFDKDPGSIQKIKWESKAASQTDVEYINSPGILSIDLIEVVRKEYKLNSYSLNSVSKYFIGDNKDDVQLSDILRAYKAYVNNSPTLEKEFTLIGKYCVQDSNLVIDLFVKLQIWLSLSEMAKTTTTQIIKVHLNGQQQKYYSQMFAFCQKNNFVVESNMYRDSSLGYTGATVLEPKPGLYENVTSLDFNSLYPTIIIGHNIDYTTIIREETLMLLPQKFIDKFLNIYEWEEHEGCIHDPLLKRKMMLDDLINNNKLKISEYRQTYRDYEKIKSKILKMKIKSTNYTKTSSLIKKKTKLTEEKILQELLEEKKLIEEKLLKNFGLENTNLETIERLNQNYMEERRELVKKISGKIKCRKNKYGFIKREFFVGVVPTIIQNLLAKRKMVRKMMETETDPDVKDVLNKRQLSYKIAANSMYGAMGVRDGSLPFMPLAMCVTYIGRTSILKAVNYIESKLDGEVVYGDTDSNYVMFKNITGNSNKEICQKIWDKAIYCAEEVSKLFPDPMRIAFEDAIYNKFLIISKKCYMYYESNREGEISNKLKYKGVLLARRDNSNFEKKIYECAVVNIMNGLSKQEVINKIIENIMEIIIYNKNSEDFKTSKSINDYNDLKLHFDNILGKWKMGNYIVKPPPDDLLLNEEEKIEFCKKCLPAQVQLEIKRIENGSEKSEGSRIEYIIVKRRNTNTQSERIVDFKRFNEERENFDIDIEHYIDKIKQPLDKLFESVYSDGNSIIKALKTFYNKNLLNEVICKIFSPSFDEI